MTKHLVTAIPHPNSDLDTFEEVIFTKESAIAIAKALREAEGFDYVCVNEIGPAVFTSALNDETNEWEENL